MSSPPHTDHGSPQPVPLGQRLFDNWFLLLVCGILIMVVIYTGWGLWKVMTLPRSALP